MRSLPPGSISTTDVETRVKKKKPEAESGEDVINVYTTPSFELLERRPLELAQRSRQLAVVVCGRCRPGRALRLTLRFWGVRT